MASSDARPNPKKNTAYRLYLPMLDADGDPVSAIGDMDTERSLDGGAMADCSNESTEITGSKGGYYIDLNASEMNTACTYLEAQGTGAKTTCISLYPTPTGGFAEIEDFVSDIYSHMVVDTSDIKSAVTVHVAAIQNKQDSDTLVLSDIVDNIYSDTTIIEEDTASDLRTLIAAATSDAESNISDILDGLGTALATLTSDVESNISDLLSAMTATAAVEHDKTQSDLLVAKLASDGLDAISVTEPTGVATTYAGMMVQLWRRFFKKSTMTATEVKTYKDNGTTVVTTQAVTDDSTTQTQGTSS